MSGCSVPECSNRNSTGFRAFVLPSDPLARAEWVRNCGRAYWTPTGTSKICEAHFDDDQWETKTHHGWIKLKPNAAPTIFNEPYPSKRGSIRMKSVRKFVQTNVETNGRSSADVVRGKERNEPRSRTFTRGVHDYKPNEKSPPDDSCAMGVKIQHIISKYSNCGNGSVDTVRLNSVESLEEENGLLRQKIFELEKRLTDTDTTRNNTVDEPSGSLKRIRSRLETTGDTSADVAQSNEHKNSSGRESMITETTDLAKIYFVKKDKHVEADGYISIDLLQGSIKTSTTNFNPECFVRESKPTETAASISECSTQESERNEKPFINEVSSFEESCLIEQIASLKREVSKLEKKLKEKDSLLQKFLMKEQVSVQFKIIPI